LFVLVIKRRQKAYNAKGIKKYKSAVDEDLPRSDILGFWKKANVPAVTSGDDGSAFSLAKRRAKHGIPARRALKR
jgi:hypothetical protein